MPIIWQAPDTELSIEQRIADLEAQVKRLRRRLRTLEGAS